MVSLFLKSLVFLVFAPGVFACTLIKNQLTKFDSTEYVLIAEVVGYVDSVELKKDVTVTRQNEGFRWSSGIRVNLVESIWSPDPDKQIFEIFQYHTNADCSLRGTSSKELRDAYPIGTEVRVVGKAATIVPQSDEGSVIRLEIMPAAATSISPNRNFNGDRISSATTLFNFSTFPLNLGRDQISRERQPDFEIRKDILRLKTTESKAERSKILDRIVLVPPFAISDFDMESLLEEFSASEADFKSYKNNLLTNWMKNDKYRKYRQRVDASNTKP
ncbi:MAG: hypothetical protein QM785_18730 [Pyrinomonadaceae bacterium]